MAVGPWSVVCVRLIGAPEEDEQADKAKKEHPEDPAQIVQRSWSDIDRLLVLAAKLVCDICLQSTEATFGK